MSDSHSGCVAYKPEISYWLLVIYLAIGISYNRDLFINRNFIYTVSVMSHSRDRGTGVRVMTLKWGRWNRVHFVVMFK